MSKQIYNLDGILTDWDLRGHVNFNGRPRSKLHLQTRELLKELFPTSRILEEVDIPVRRGQILYLDFYVLSNSMAVEVHGEQHYSYSSLFHGSKKDLLLQKKRDNEKAEWCEINGIKLVVLPFNEDINEWTNRIKTV